MRYAWITAALLMLATFNTAHAAPTLLIENGKLIGATGIEVQGNFFDVRFTEGTCATVFGSCEATSYLFGGRHADATAASEALLNSVLRNGVSLALDDFPDLTYGCEYSLLCTIITPWQDDQLLSYTSVSMVINRPTEVDEYVIDNGWFRQIDTNTQRDTVWAVWTAGQPSIGIAEPSTLAVVLTGLAALVSTRRKYRRA